MNVQAILPVITADAILPGAQFIDAYCVDSGDRSLDARRAAELMVGRQPAWVSGLLRLRNLLVAPFGLKRPDPG